MALHPVMYSHVPKHGQSVVHKDVLAYSGNGPVSSSFDVFSHNIHVN